VGLAVATDILSKYTEPLLQYQVCVLNTIGDDRADEGDKNCQLSAIVTELGRR